MTVAEEPVDFDTDSHVDAVLAMQVGPAIRHLVAQRGLQ